MGCWVSGWCRVVVVVGGWLVMVALLWWWLLITMVESIVEDSQARHHGVDADRLWLIQWMKSSLRLWKVRVRMKALLTVTW